MIVIDGYKLDDLATEAFAELRADQDPKDFYKYFGAATESISNPETRVKMVSKLYDDLMKRGYIDFDKIPLSKGDLTKYKHFDNLTKTIQTLDKLFKGNKTEEYKMTEKLYNMIISCRSDFEYGFKFDVELIQFSYNTLVLALHRMIDITIASFVKYMYDIVDTPADNMLDAKIHRVEALAMNAKYPRVKYAGTASSYETLLVVNGVKQVLKMYDKGEWTQMITSFKKGRNNWLGTVGAVAKSAGLITGSGTDTAVTAAGAAVLGVVSLIVFIISLRKIVYVFYSTAYKIDESVKRNRQFVEFTLKNSVDQSTSAIMKQQQILQFYDRIHDVIESKVFAENVKAEKKLKESNRARFTIPEIGPDNFAQATIVEAPQPTLNQSEEESYLKSNSIQTDNDDVKFF